MIFKKLSILALVNMVLFLLGLGLFEGVASAKPKFKLETKQRFQVYTVQIYYDDENGNGKFEIWRKNKRIYQKTDESKFYIGGLPITENETNNALIKMGIDITGKGFPNLVISEWTGGAHCCFNFYVFELGPQFRFLAKIEANHSDLSHFANLDGDTNLEFVGNDWTFAYWNASFGQSPAPDIILRFQDGAYRFAEDLMRKPAPSEAELTAKIQALQADESWTTIGTPAESLPVALWEEMLDLIYTGHADLAWQFFERAWPAQIAGKAEFLAEFRAQLAKSPYWPQIEHLNSAK